MRREIRGIVRSHLCLSRRKDFRSKSLTEHQSYSFKACSFFGIGATYLLTSPYGLTVSEHPLFDTYLTL